MTIEGEVVIPRLPGVLEYLKSIVLVGIRLGGLFIFAPIFSSTAIVGRLKIGLLIVMTISLGPMLCPPTLASINIDIPTIAREIAISLVFGLCLSMIMELANTAGQAAGMQFSFTLVNLLDPNSNIETPLFSQIFQLLTTTVLVSAGFDRIIISSMIRTYVGVPLGGEALHSGGALATLPILGDVLLAAIQLISPLIVATVLVEVSIALVSRLSPQLPVLALTIPAKTIVGFAVLTLTLASWTMFIEKQFSGLLDVAQRRITEMFGG